MKLKIIEKKVKIDNHSNACYLLKINKTIIGSCHLLNLSEIYPYYSGSRYIEFDDNYYDSKGLANITSLYIDEKYRGRGYGSYLLKYVMNKAYKNGIRYMELEDASDYCFKKNCIYLKLGFKYDQLDGHMICNLRHNINKNKKQPIK